MTNQEALNRLEEDSKATEDSFWMKETTFSLSKPGFTYRQNESVTLSD